MSGRRHFSQAISEGDGISIVVVVDRSSAAESALAQGAEALVVTSHAALEAVRPASELPILSLAEGELEESIEAGTDAVALDCEHFGAEESIEEFVARAAEKGLDCLIEVRAEDEIERALELLDPEIFLLTPLRDSSLDEQLEHVLELLPDIPAGKLAVARLDALPSREQVSELERAGVDAVIVGSGDIAGIAGGAVPGV